MRFRTRLYTDQHIVRLKAIIHLTENGFSLDVIRLFGDARKKSSTGNEGSQKISSIIDNSIDNIEEKIRTLTVLKKELLASKKVIVKCKGCKNIPSSDGCPLCPVNKNLNKIEMLNLIWE